MTSKPDCHQVHFSDYTFKKAYNLDLNVEYAHIMELGMPEFESTNAFICLCNTYDYQGTYDSLAPIYAGNIMQTQIDWSGGCNYHRDFTLVHVSWDKGHAGVLTRIWQGL